MEDLKAHSKSRINPVSEGHGSALSAWEVKRALNIFG